MTKTVQTQREEAIRQYMLGWQNGDEALLTAPLSPDVCITESYGPVYEGLAEVRQWFQSWCSVGQVLRWDGLRFWHQDDETVVKWYFQCNYDGVVSSLDGLSLIRFDRDGCITSMEEYQSKAEHFRPYAAPKTQH